MFVLPSVCLSELQASSTIKKLQNKKSFLIKLICLLNKNVTFKNKVMLCYFIFFSLLLRISPIPCPNFSIPMPPLPYYRVIEMTVHCGTEPFVRESKYSILSVNLFLVYW